MNLAERSLEDYDTPNFALFLYERMWSREWHSILVVNLYWEI